MKHIGILSLFGSAAAAADQTQAGQYKMGTFIGVITHLQYTNKRVISSHFPREMTIFPHPDFYENSYL